jgi:hypothetical protein
MRQATISRSAGEKIQLTWQQEANAMSDMRCLHCWLREQLQAAGCDVEVSAELWSVLRRAEPRVGYALSRLVFKDSVYVEDHNATAIAELLRFDNQQRLVFYGLNFRNRKYCDLPRGKTSALSYCRRD